jgi:hypothetical protein
LVKHGCIEEVVWVDGHWVLAREPIYLHCTDRRGNAKLRK